jgi:hypothetical protein
MLENPDSSDKSAADTFLYYQLIQASLCGEQMEIEGVNFDLSHADLDRQDWRPVSIVGWPPRHLHEPRLLFPWSDQSERKVFKARGKGTEVFLGDLVKITSVVRMPVRTDHGVLDHPHHRESRWANLLVRRKSGAEINVAQAWEFRGSADVITPASRRDFSQAYVALQARLAEAIGLVEIDDLVLADTREEAMNHARSATELYQLAAEALWEAEQNLTQDSGAVFGYLIGRAEAAELLLPDAVRGHAQHDKLRAISKRPRKSGDQTRAAAIVVIDAKPGISRRKCAERVADIRELKDVRGVERTIARLFRQTSDRRYLPDLQAISAEKLRLKERT